MEFELTVTDDKLLASIMIKSSGAISKRDLIAQLKEQNIVFGLIDSELETISKNPTLGLSVEIAMGEPVEEGIEGSIDYLYEQLQIKKSGSRVDHYELSTNTFVKKGMKLAKRIKPIPGKSGKNVFGEEILPKDLPDIILPLGTNVVPDPNDEDVCIADCSGVLERSRDGNLSINPVFEVKKNVDFSVGNINFDGSVFIGGDIKANFNVTATNDIEIKGVIEDAFIDAGGSIKCKQGFVGYNKGEMNARGNIEINHIVNQTVAAHKDITIHTEAIESELLCGGSIIAEKGRIIGGSTLCRGDIKCNQVGNSSNQLTKIRLGIDTITQREITRLKNKMREENGKIKQFNHEIKKFELLKSRGNSLSDDVLKILGKYKVAVDTLEKNIQLMKTEINDLSNTKDGEDIQSKLIVTGTIYPNVFITIGSGSYKTTETVSAVQFQLNSHGAVEVVPYST